MKAKAKVHGAISLLNAIATGKGAAIGINLPVEVEASIDTNDNFLKITYEGHRPEDNRLVVSAISVIKKQFGYTKLGVNLKIRSEIPIGKGLKSSSSVANALVLALTSALGIKLSDDQILSLSITVAKHANVTVTGALDDCAASYYGGIVITDNYKGEIIRQEHINESIKVLIFVPQKTILTGDIDTSKFELLADFFDKVFALIIERKYWLAMIINGFLVSLATTYWDYLPETLKSLKAGALSVGVSGTGPAVTVLYNDTVNNGIIKLWKSRKGKIILTELCNNKTEVIVYD